MMLTKGVMLLVGHASRLPAAVARRLWQACRLALDKVCPTALHHLTARKMHALGRFSCHSLFVQCRAVLTCGLRVCM
jgi:hypothetical protein